jgi:hypothetical protein
VEWPRGRSRWEEVGDDLAGFGDCEISEDGKSKIDDGGAMMNYFAV